jgi:glycosyltransferase involved in cell wall biosynthesis
VNVGCDISKNIGLALADGEYITSHDADDWAHPERIERQVTAILRSEGRIVVARVGGLRINFLGEFTRFARSNSEDYRDGSLALFLVTTMYETKFLRKSLGFWDSVRAGADREMFERARRIHPSGVTVFDQFAMFSLDSGATDSHNALYGCFSQAPISDLYRKNFGLWHRELTPGDALLPLVQSLANRRFPAPATILVPEYQVRRALQGLPEDRLAALYPATANS